uniref:Uncharacterized protein n=1 Tax=Pipistrellus kuhlii TaxID=59472 RepID=A0A7J7W3C2_PIPKU|nr:hypothetical protein mPipKuh1_008195 [Pipistrellus kuhlii]
MYCGGWEGCPLARPAPSHSMGALRGGRRPGNQGKVKPHHVSAAATAGSASLCQPWLPEPPASAGQQPSEVCLRLGLVLRFACSWGPQGLGDSRGRQVEPSLRWVNQLAYSLLIRWDISYG